MNDKQIEYFDEYLELVMEYKLLKSNNMSIKHFHNSYEIYYLAKGSRIFLIENELLNILPGSLVVIAPRVVHQVLNATDSQYKSFIINFTRNSLPAKQQYNFAQSGSLFKKNYTILSFTEDKQEIFRKYTESALTEIEAKASEYELSLYGIFLQMLAFCQREYESQRMHTQSASDTIPTRIESIILYINKNYFENLSLTKLSEIFFISPAYLSRSFKKETGVPLVDYINAVRIQKAIPLLSSSKNSVGQVAKKCGFSSLPNFNRVFKLITGHPPSFYKKINNLKAECNKHRIV